MKEEEKAQHSPGTWIVDGYTPLKIWSDEKGGSALICTLTKRPSMEANARLIASAPDILSALKQLFEHCAMTHKYWGEGSNAKEAQSAIDAARAAIAKAGGRAE